MSLNKLSLTIPSPAALLNWHTPPIFSQSKPLWWLHDAHLIKACMSPVIPTFQNDFPYSHTWGLGLGLLGSLNCFQLCMCGWNTSVSCDGRWISLLGWTPASPVTGYRINETVVWTCLILYHSVHKDYAFTWPHVSRTNEAFWRQRLTGKL